MRRVSFSQPREIARGPPLFDMSCYVALKCAVRRRVLRKMLSQNQRDSHGVYSSSGPTSPIIKKLKISAEAGFSGEPVFEGSRV